MDFLPHVGTLKALLFSFLSCPHNCWERGESQHVTFILGTGNYFFLWVNEGNYKNWGEENDLWTCSNCLDFFPDFLLLQNLEFWAFEGPFQAKKTKRCERRRYIWCWRVVDIITCIFGIVASCVNAHNPWFTTFFSGGLTTPISSSGIRRMHNHPNALTGQATNPGLQIRHFEKNSRAKKLKTQGKNSRI